MSMRFLFTSTLLLLSCFLGNSSLLAKELDSKPCLLPENHPLKPTLDKIFANPKVLDNPKTFAKSGFKTIFLRSRGSLRVAKHPALKGYLFKLYLKSETKKKYPVYTERLARRAIEANRIRKFIQQRKIRRFTVPDKWIYVPPFAQGNKGVYVLVVQDAQLVSREKSASAWKEKITPSHLKELHALLKRGYGSIAVIQNIPYTKKKTFSFIDTEFPPRKFNLQRVGSRLDKNMRQQWQKLIKK